MPANRAGFKTPDVDVTLWVRPGLSASLSSLGSYTEAPCIVLVSSRGSGAHHLVLPVYSLMEIQIAASHRFPPDGICTMGAVGAWYVVLSGRGCRQTI
jgi:hypothetical protein